MKAIIRERYGSPDVLKLADIERPTPAAGEVLVRVFATSVNQGDWFTLTGTPLVFRLVYGLVTPKLKIPGMDLAGRVEMTGPDTTRFAPGDEVFGEATQAYADYAVVPEDRLWWKPANLSFEEAAAVPVAGITALQGLRDKGRVQPGSRVLINGASGGVGTFAIQIAKALGAEVTGVCSPRNLEIARSLGADRVIDYSREDFTRRPERFDTIFDLAGSRPLSDCLRLRAPGGVYVSSVGRLGWIIKVVATSWVERRGVTLLVAQQTPADLATLKDMLESGAIKPCIDRRFTLAEVPAALRYQGEGHARGKSVITVAGAESG